MTTLPCSENPEKTESEKEKKGLDKSKDSAVNQICVKELSELKILFRFNCGQCCKNCSKITVSKMFSKTCRKCNFTCELVVLRCNESILFGGYICSGCNERFLAKFPMKQLEKISPSCVNCNIPTKVYQILLNKSKISVRNIVVYKCKVCKASRNKAFYSKSKILKKKNSKSDSIPTCCDNKLMKYSKLIRIFSFIKLDTNGNSPSYYEKNKNKV